MASDVAVDAALVAFVLDWKDDDGTAMDSAQAARVQARLDEHGLRPAYWRVAAALCPLLARAPCELSVLLAVVQQCMALTRDAGWEAIDYIAASDLTANPKVVAVLELLRDVHQYAGYYASLAQHKARPDEADAPAPDPATEWLEEMLVRRLYRHSMHELVTGCLLVPVPFGAPQDARPQPRLMGWMRPFTMLPKKWRYDPTTVLHAGARWAFVESADAARAALPDDVVAALRASGGKLVLAGGAPMKAALGWEHDVSDYDLFLVGCRTKAEALEVVQRAVRAMLERQPAGVGTTITMLSKHVLTLTQMQTQMQMQIVLRLFRTPEEVLATFDLPSCCFMFDGDAWYTTKRALYALRYRVNLMDPLQQSTPRRAYKYHERGFHFVVPGWDVAWEEQIMFARDVATKDELIVWLREGGLRAIIAFCYLPARAFDFTRAAADAQAPDAHQDLSVERGAVIASRMYQCLYRPELLLDAAWRTSFLAHCPMCQVYVHTAPAPETQEQLDAMLTGVLPPELLHLLATEDEPRWLIRNPALRMYSVEQFYNLDVSVPPYDRQAAGDNDM